MGPLCRLCKADLTKLGWGATSTIDELSPLNELKLSVNMLTSIACIFSRCRCGLGIREFSHVFCGLCEGCYRINADYASLKLMRRRLGTRTGIAKRWNGYDASCPTLFAWVGGANPKLRIHKDICNIPIYPCECLRNSCM